MSVTRSPGPAPEISHPTHSTKKLRRTPKERQPPKLKRRSYKATKTLFSHDANGISYQRSSSNTPSLYKLPKNSHYLTYFRQNFDDMCPIGEGSFGEVFRVRCRTTGCYYAVKRSKERFRSEFDRKQKLEEVRKHELIPKHNNCVQFIRAWEEDDYLYIQLELCRTSLEEYTLVHHELTQAMLWDILLDIALAVKHLHDHNLLHLDIKLENILVALDGTFKLGDFGLVIDISKEDTEDAVEGDPKYLAPELMTGHFTRAADIFSLGITMLELASDLDLPSRGPLWHELRNGIFPDDHTKHICPALFDLIKTMMSPAYTDRPAIDDILAHPHLRKLMYKRRRLHYVNQVLSQMQSLYNMGRAALKTFMGMVLLPLGYLNNGGSGSCITKDYMSNGYVNGDKLNGEWGNSYSDDDNGGRSTPDNSSSSCNLFSASPNMSPIGRDGHSFFNMSVPDILITNSTPTRTPPQTPRKRSSDSLHDAIVPINNNVKRMCVSHAELHPYSDNNEFSDEISPDCYHFSFIRTATRARNLLPMFGSCED
ncbi:membrane-associated tyrosine- and threonine-specific cdc2-inhibitory kinase-like [Periplaneta americana]|uniref:membrane-associated tyrosine- and threonine-specific cdc2-inhibitory kinase-like n=1 Tax=Periplaneta americana TaxID=6978 RepID=UPI0037E7CDA5